MRRYIAVAVALACAPMLLAQGKWQQEWAKHLKTSGEFTVAVADQMPEDGYSFAPNAEEMNFGALMVHIAMSQANSCARATEGKSPLTKPEKADKATSVKLLKEAFTFCEEATAKISDEQLDKMVTKTQSAREVLWAYFTHTAHHRGQAEVYLRVKNIKPPGYRF